MTSAMSPTRIRLAASARRELIDIAERTTGRDGLEVGGVLLGTVHRDVLEVVQALDPGPRAVRQRCEFRGDAEHDVAAVREAVERSDGQLREVGAWHSHAIPLRAPSPADLTSLARRRAFLGLERSLMLIAVPDEDGWDLEAIVARATHGTFDIAERARLTTAGRESIIATT